MRRIRLICWKEELAQERLLALAASELPVDASPCRPSELAQSFRQDDIAAVLIDLDRLPSHGREVAVWLRNRKATRSIPIVFAGGVPEKVEKIRVELPDAIYTDWLRAAAALKRALRSAPAVPVQPAVHMARYAGSDLAKKLGIASSTQLKKIGAPDGFEELLGDLPESGAGRAARMTLWFVRSRAELDGEIDLIAGRLGAGEPLWIIYPKQSAPKQPAARRRNAAVDFNQFDVRAAGLRVGLVDYKVCSVNTELSGLKFVHRKK